MTASSDQESDEDKQATEHPTELDCPSSEEELYYTLEPDCDDLRPICQGDVFRDLCLPGFDDDHDLVMVIGHPCSLRAGPKLRPRLQAVAVRPYQRVPIENWGNSHPKVFPLPLLPLSKHHAAELSYPGIVTPAQISLDKRIATLSAPAILLLQQRIVWTSAHAIVKLDTFEDFNAGVLTELELLEFWNEQLCDELEGEERAAALLATAKEFDDYLKKAKLHQELEEPERRGEARARIRAEALRRREQPA